MKAYKVTENGVEKIKVANKPLANAPVYYASKLSDKVQYFNTTPQYTVVGNVTIINGIARGFSDNSYCYLNSLFYDTSNTWKIVIKGKVNTFSTVRTFISYGGNNKRAIQVSVTTGRTLIVYLSSNGSTNDIANGVVSTSKLDYETYYYVKAEFTGTQYVFSMSTDGQNYTTYITVNSSTPIYNGAQLTLGYNKSQYPEPIDGEIDLNETYIIANNKVFFRGNFPNFQE